MVERAQDTLPAYLEAARSNQIATSGNKKDVFRHLSEVDACFVTLAHNMINPSNLVSALLFFRSHSAFRTACATVCSGQVPETFVLLRSCLEYAAYALHIFKNPPLGETWLRRHEDESALRRVRNEFKVSEIRATVVAADGKLGQIFADLYERSIDFGGHPNERGVVGSVSKGGGESRIEYFQQYLHGDDLSLLHALKTTAQVGLCSLHIFQHVFTERFTLLGIREKLPVLRRGL